MTFSISILYSLFYHKLSSIFFLSYSIFIFPFSISFLPFSSFQIYIFFILSIYFSHTYLISFITLYFVWHFSHYYFYLSSIFPFISFNSYSIFVFIFFISIIIRSIIHTFFSPSYNPQVGSLSDIFIITNHIIQPTFNFIVYASLTSRSTSIIITLIIEMGICGPQRKDKQIIYTSKSVHQPDKFKKVDFYFQSQNLLRIEADCLMIFCDEKMNLGKNQFLASTGKLQTKKVTQFAQSYVTRNQIKITPGTVMLFPINIATLRFKRICLICLKVWDGHEKIKSNLQEIFENAFKQIVESQIQSLAITQLNQSFGIPIQAGCKAIISTLETHQQNLKAVTFLFQNSSSQTYYMEKISKDKLELSSVYKQSRQSSISNYY